MDVMTDEEGSPVPQPPEGARDIRHWGVETPDGTWVAGMADDVYLDMSAAFPADAERRHVAREIAAQANRLDTLVPGDEGYPRYEIAGVLVGLSGPLRLEGFAPGRVWMLYVDDPVIPPTEV
jgi:hypothetical protein